MTPKSIRVEELGWRVGWHIGRERPVRCCLTDVLRISCVVTSTTSLVRAPAVVRRMRWKVYWVERSRAETVVEVLARGWGMEAGQLLWRQRSRERRVEVEKERGDQVRVQDVCVVLRSWGGGEGM